VIGIVRGEEHAVAGGAAACRCPTIRRPPPLRRSEKAARRILDIANAVEPIQGWIHIEKINGPFLFRDGASPAEYSAGIKLAIGLGWLLMHEPGTFVTFTPEGAKLFA
jgi:hypothetical protein